MVNNERVELRVFVSGEYKEFPLADARFTGVGGDIEDNLEVVITKVFPAC